MVCSCVCVYTKTKPNKEVKHDHTKWFVWRIKKTHFFQTAILTPKINRITSLNHRHTTTFMWCVLRHWNSYNSFARPRLRLQAHFSKKFNIIFFDEIHSYVKSSCDLINKFNWKTPREWVKKKQKDNNDNNDDCTLVLSLFHNKNGKLSKTTGCFCPCTTSEMISWNKSNWQLKRKTKTYKAELFIT